VIDLFVFLDAETSGLLRKELPADDPAQPHLLQLAAKAVRVEFLSSVSAFLKDTKRTLGQFSLIVRPDGWEVEPGAERIHGISTRLAAQVGVPCWLVLAQLKAMVANATRIIGHNLMGFDYQIIDLAIKRVGSDPAWWRGKTGILFDTMEHATPIVRLPGQFGDYKFPSLEEAVRFFGKDWSSRHDPADDVEACEFVFWQLAERRATPQEAENPEKADDQTR